MEKFYLGTDIGTNSVGVACTDENYELLRAKGKDCWTVRLFEEGETAAERRTFRTARRRLERRKQRIGWLQGLFAPYIDDETFFIRLNNSQFLPEDKNELLGGDKNTLFSGAYDDKKFHKEFPTVYHLREALISGGAYDLRLYYLALHHIIKYRGHFLFEGTFEDMRDFKRLLVDLNDRIYDAYADEVPSFSAELADEAKEILLDRRCGVKDKTSKLEKLFAVNDKKGKEIVKGLCGGKISPSVLFAEEYKEEKSFSLKELSDEAFDAMRLTYGDDFALLEAIRSICGFITFENLLVGHSDLSSAMIAVYEKHKSDLSKLKAFIKSERPQDYNKIFKSTTEGKNYVNYIGYTKKGGDKKKVDKCKDEDFYKYIKNYLEALTDVNNAAARDEMLSEIENGTFMPKILHSDNGLFPRQINESELNKIVENMVKFHPETLPIKEKISTLFKYKIPYYVGPLGGENSWAVKKQGMEEEKVDPWNFDEVIDKAASNEEFMRRMTNKCTYLRGEDVLPKASITYQKFDVLNQLNKLRVNDELLPVELKQKIFNELFLKYPKVSDKKIIDLLVKEGKISPADKASTVLSGKDGEFKASMSSYVRLKKFLGDFVDRDLSSGGGVCENIILWHTLNTDKSVVCDLIKKNYGNVPEISNSLAQLKGLTFNDFGRLSQKLLCGIYTIKPDTGELWSILDALYETNENLNEILNDERFTFGEKIKAENGEFDEEVGYEDVENLYVSPAVKRGIWQTLLVADEYVKAIGRAPDKIFVEVTREDGVKGDAGRTQPRKKQLQEKFRNVGAAYADVVQELADDKYSDMRLRQERLFLYFRQLGRCMYSGERIDLDELNTDLYDVDHILPRTFIKDDSLDNKVLVLRSKNAKKSDTYPLPAGFSDQRDFWKMLLDKNLIARVTYDRLTRTEPLREDEYRDFINRQKVITDQTVKAVAELFKRKYPATKIVYSKAKNVSDFKQKFGLFKCRETNDLHHAKDAYLNVVVGNVFDTVFSKDISMFRKDGDVWRTYNLKKMFTRDVAGAWNDKTIVTVKKIFEKPSASVTRYATCFNGGFYDQTVYGKNDGSVTAPRKGSGPLADTSKYGGYKSQPTAYFAIVSSLDKKGNEIKTIEAVPVLVAYRLKTDADALQKYLDERLTKPKILVPRVKNKQLVSYNGTRCYLAGITGSQIGVYNAVQLFTDNKTDEYVNGLIKVCDMKTNGTIDGTEEEYVIKTNRDGQRKLVVDKTNNIELYHNLIGRLGNKIYQGLSAFSTFKKNLEKGEERFSTLPVCDQASVLLQILKFLKCNAETANITLIGGSAHAGKIYINVKITDVDFRIIDLSPAGLTERVRKV